MEKISEMETLDFDRIESYMKKHTGGEIYLGKDYWNEGIAVICINRPEKKNAITGKMMVDFRRCVEALEAWEDGKGVLLCGMGESFCGGGDLDFARKCNTELDAYCMSNLMQDVLNRLRKLPLLTVALIQGPVIGGGAEITIFCDHVLAVENTKLGFVHARMGITTAWGATTRLVKLLGEREALELFLTARILTAEECLKIGLVRKLVKLEENRIDVALEWLRTHLNFDKTVTRSFKKAILHAAENESYENSLAFERQLFYKLWGAEPNRRALEANIKHVKK